MSWLARAVCFASGLSVASLALLCCPGLSGWTASLSILLLLVLLWQWYRRRESGPRSKAFRELQRIRRKQEKIAIDKHHHINDQIDYIATEWGYTKEQQRTIDRFLAQRAYTKMYNRLSASLLPQLITMIDQCLEREQKGCKREVSRRIRELTRLMKEELRRKRTQSRESFETTLEVYDRLISERHD